MAAEMIERVSLAINKAGYEACSLPFQEWETITEKQRQAIIVLAKAAIAAMREPTNKMLNGLGINLKCRETYMEYKFYQKMIDAALKEDINDVMQQLSSPL